MRYLCLYYYHRLDISGRVLVPDCVTLPVVNASAYNVYFCLKFTVPQKKEN